MDQAAKDEMLCISHVTLRALQGSCDLGAKVEVWFSLVLKFLSHCLPLNGSNLSQALIRIWKEKHICGAKIRFKIKFYKWFWSNRSVCSWEWGELKMKRWIQRRKKTKALYITPCDEQIDDMQIWLTVSGELQTQKVIRDQDGVSGATSVL